MFKASLRPQVTCSHISCSLVTARHGFVEPLGKSTCEITISFILLPASGSREYN